MTSRYSPYVLALSLCAAGVSPAAAQGGLPVAPVPASIQDAVLDLTAVIGAPPVGEALALATRLEVANAPFGTSAGGFVFTIDPATGLTVRTAPTFGPSFAERALTAGEGKVTVGANLILATYDRLNDFSLRRMNVIRTESATPADRLAGFGSLVLSSETLVVSGAVGATDKLDIAVAVPFIKVKLNGTAWSVRQDEPEQALNYLAREISSSGIGDLAVSAKYRLKKFGEDLPDPGGVAAQLVTRMPTGNRENLRGMGITRVLGSVIVSSGRGRLRPHANAGFEWWEKGLVVNAGFTGEVDTPPSVEARHQVQYAGGIEFEAGPKMTLLADVLGRHVLGGGTVSLESVPVPASFPRVTAMDVAIATTTGIRKLTLAPGLKWNVKGNLVFSGSALIPLLDNGLYDFFTPVIGLDLTF